MVYLNIPILMIGGGIVYKALAHYRATNGGKFISEKDIGVQTDYCTEALQKHLPENLLDSYNAFSYDKY